MGLVRGDECSRVEEAQYAVFDDMRGGIKFFPAFKEWMGCQMHVTVKQLYREPKLLPWGKPTIWVANTDPRVDMTPEDANWLTSNAVFIEVSSPIFHANTE